MLNSIKRKEKFHSRLTRSRSCMFSLSCLTSISRVSGSCITDLKAKTNCIPLNSNWYLSGFAKRYLQDLLATVSSEACSVLDHFFLMFSVQKTPDKSRRPKKKKEHAFLMLFTSPPSPFRTYQALWRNKPRLILAKQVKHWFRDWDGKASYCELWCGRWRASGLKK